MEEKYGKLVWVDEHDYQNAYIKEGTKTFLEEMGVAHADQEIEKITDVFMNNGNMRGRIFYNGKFRSFRKKDGILRIPVHGVRGKHSEKSMSNYAHWYVEREQDLLGEGFFRAIFGNYFGTEEEYRLLKKPEEMFGKQARHTAVKEDNIEDITAVHLMERLWAALEQNTSARIVIVLSKHMDSEDGGRAADEESMDILRRIYPMIPQRLRLETGFATCVTPSEIVELAENRGLPIYIFTTDKGADLTELNNRDLSYHVIRMDEEDIYTYNETRQEWLEKLLDFRAKNRLEELLNISEAEYLKQKKAEINFGAYEVILDLIIVPWYEKDKKGDLSDLLYYRKAQEAVLECGGLEKERRIFFLGQVLPDKEYGNQLVQLIYGYELNLKNQKKDIDKSGEKPQNQKKDIDEIREKLGLGYLIDAIQKMYDNTIKCDELISKKYAKEIEDLRVKEQEQEQFISRLNAGITEKTNQYNQLSYVYREKEQQIIRLSKDYQNKTDEIKQLKEDIQMQENTISEYKNEIVKLHEYIEKLRKEVSDLNDCNGNLIQDNEKLKKELARKTEEGELRQQFELKVLNLEANYARREHELKNINDILSELRNEVYELKAKKGVIQYLKKLLCKMREKT